MSLAVFLFLLWALRVMVMSPLLSTAMTLSWTLAAALTLSLISVLVLTSSPVFLGLFYSTFSSFEYGSTGTGLRFPDLAGE